MSSSQRRRQCFCHASRKLWHRNCLAWCASQIPIRLLRRFPILLDDCSTSWAVGSDYQGSPKQSPLMGASAPSLRIFNHRDTLRRSSASWGNFSPAAARLAFPRHIGKALVVVWDQPYLETCCRSALHRLQLSRRAGRPPDLLDGKCLLRIASMGLCDQRPDGRFVISAEGIRRHAAEVLQRPFR
jgi:hypothetical protein